MCLWEISLSRVSAFLSPEFKERLASVGSAVGYNWTDRDNAPASVYIAQTPPDGESYHANQLTLQLLLSKCRSPTSPRCFHQATLPLLSSCRKVSSLTRAPWLQSCADRSWASASQVLQYTFFTGGSRPSAGSPSGPCRLAFLSTPISYRKAGRKRPPRSSNS